MKKKPPAKQGVCDGCFFFFRRGLEGHKKTCALLNAPALLSRIQRESAANSTIMHDTEVEIDGDDVLMEETVDAFEADDEWDDVSVEDEEESDVEDFEDEVREEHLDEEDTHLSQFPAHYKQLKDHLRNQPSPPRPKYKCVSQRLLCEALNLCCLSEKQKAIILQTILDENFDPQQLLQHKITSVRRLERPVRDCPIGSVSKRREEKKKIGFELALSRASLIQPVFSRASFFF